MWLNFIPLFLLFGRFEAANILYAYSLPSPSHFIWNSAIVKMLVENGHNVTFLGPFLGSESRTDLYHPIDMERLSATKVDIKQAIKFSVLDKFNFYFDIDYFCDLSFNSQNFQKFLQTKHNFDLLIVDITIIPCFLPLVQIFDGVPVVGVVPFLLPPEYAHMFGTNFQPAYLPHFLNTASQSMDFLDRVVNFLYVYGTEICYHYYLDIWHRIAKERYGNHIKPYQELSSRITLLLANVNPIFDFPQPLPPNIIPVGSLHVENPKQLPKDLETIMKNSQNGVIIFSLGTNVDIAEINPSKIDSFLEAFQQLNQTIIWKTRELPKTLPKNVITRKWLPQNDLIGHPNTKLFIGHGGALSTQEAFYHGVPMLAIPFYLDQLFTSQMVQDKKRGLKLDFNTLDSESLLKAIREILENPIYRENVKDLSKKFKDLPTKLRDMALSWISYAIKYNGTEFLNVKARNMTFIQYTSLDVIAFLLVLIVLLILFFVYLFKKVLRVFGGLKIKIE